MNAAGNQQGPIGLDEIQEMFADGAINENTLVFRQGMKDWRPLQYVPEIVMPEPQKETMPDPRRPALQRANYIKSKPVEEKSGNAATIIMTLILPIVGLVVGIVYLCRPNRQSDGIAHILLGLVMIPVWMGILEKLGK
jgi:hypothetical protein